jgi:penicillin-binding protein 2
MNGSPSLNNNVEPWRILTLAGLIGLVFVAYLVRLFNLQVVQAQDYVTAAEDNRTDLVNEPAARGVIYDRNQTILARNVASYNVVITAADLPDDPGAVQEIFREMSELIDMPVSQGDLNTPYVPCISEHGIAQIAQYAETSKPFAPVELKCDIDREMAMVVQEKAVDWPGIGILVQPIRDYPTGSLTASIVGFLGPIPAIDEEYYRDLGFVPNRDKVGYAGMELQFQDLLAGRNGQRVVEIDVAGKVLRSVNEPQLPVAGLNIRTTIDTRLQQAAEAIFKQEIKSWNDYFAEIRYSSGVVIAMNPKTGEILAMVSYPTYENNRMARFIPAYYYEQLVNDPANPILNHAVGDTLPAGSVFKISTAVGALNEGVVTPDQVLETPPKLIVQERFSENQRGTEREFVDWNEAGFGHLDFIGGISNSSNVYFYKLGGGYQDEVPEGLGICRLGTYAHALGYGEVPEVELPEVEKGLIPDPKWKRITHGEGWSTGDTYIASVGQGYVLATPMQVLLSAATIANDGKLMRPTLIREIVDGDGKTVEKWLTPDGEVVDQPVENARQISPFAPIMRWDITRDKIIKEYFPTTIQGCEETGEYKTVQSWVIEKVQEGMRRAVTHGTLSNPETVGFDRLEQQGIAAAGKTGTAEYCDQYAKAKNRCTFGNWPTHAWSVAYAPYNDPEIAVVAFVYNGDEGASVAGPIVRQVLQAYFELKTIDNTLQPP